VGTRCANHVTPLYPQKLALTSPTGGGRSVGMVRSRTKSHGEKKGGEKKPGTTTIQNRIHFDKNIFRYKDLGNHLLQQHPTH